MCHRTKFKRVDSQLLLYKYLIQLKFRERVCNEPDREIKISVSSPPGKWTGNNRRRDLWKEKTQGVAQHPERIDSLSFFGQPWPLFQTPVTWFDVPFARSFWGPQLWSDGGRAKHKPLPDPPTRPVLLHCQFPVIQACGAISTSRCQANINQEATAPGLFEKLGGTLQSLSRGAQRGGRGMRHKEKVICGSFNHGVEGEGGESSSRAPKALPRSQL